MAPAANQEQQRIDEAIHIYKAGTASLPLSSTPTDAANPAQLGLDLASVTGLLEGLSHRLANNESTVAAHSFELQSLDIAIQALGAVASMLIGDGDEGECLAKLANVRVSCRNVPDPIS